MGPHNQRLIVSQKEEPHFSRSAYLLLRSEVHLNLWESSDSPCSE